MTTFQSLQGRTKKLIVPNYFGLLIWADLHQNGSSKSRLPLHQLQAAAGIYQRKYKTNPVRCLVSPDFPLEGVVDGIELIPASHVQPDWFLLPDPINYPERENDESRRSSKSHSTS